MDKLRESVQGTPKHRGGVTTTITNDEFKRLMSISKHFFEDNISLPALGAMAKPYSVYSDSTKDVFLLDTDHSSRMTLNRIKMQERYLNVPEQLIRLEIDSRPHTNPDGEVLSRNHIHIYQEGYGLSWAYDIMGLNDRLFKDIATFNNVFYDFCTYCNIDTTKTYIQDVI